MGRTRLLLTLVASGVLLASGAALAATVDCEAGALRCVGTDDPDTLNGTDEHDLMLGKAGGDTLLGNGGKDSLKGGPGDDVEKGGEGNDRFNIRSTDGDAGDDRFYGGPGDDYLYINSSNFDGVSLGIDQDVLSGGPGKDDVWGTHRMLGGPGDDRMIGLGYGGDVEVIRTIVGGPGEDRIRSVLSAQDTIRVDDGQHDTVNCGGGNDTVYHDEGLDTINLDHCENLVPAASH